MKPEMIKGMDISSLTQMLKAGVEYYDFDGNKTEPLSFIKECGVNAIRLRIWNNPENRPESGGFCNLAQTVEFAKKIKEKGFSLVLDFHYSDWWADPGQQNKPKAWENLSFPQLVGALHDYTYTVLKTLQDADALPDMVQIGNEIRSGMLFPEGSVANWPNLAALINNGISAVREIKADKKIEIMLHLDQGGRYHYFKEWFDAALAHGVTDFDCIGLSYYPFWHGGFTGFKNTLDSLAERYNKPLIAAETAYARKIDKNGVFSAQQERIGGFSATPQGQYDVLKMVICILSRIERGLGRGFFYWEPLAVPLPTDQGGWSVDMPLIDENARPLEGLRAYQYDPFSFDTTKIAKVFPVALSPQNPEPPKTVQVLLWDGTAEERAAVWQFPEGQLPCGKLQSPQDTVDAAVLEIPVELRWASDSGPNLLRNGSFDDQMTEWEHYCDQKRAVCEVKGDADNGNYLFVSSPVNFKMEIFQQTDLLKEGCYTLSAEMRGENTTGVKFTLFAELGDNKYEQFAFLQDAEYDCFKLENILVKNESIRVGIAIDSPPIEAKVRCIRLTAC